MFQIVRSFTVAKAQIKENLSNDRYIRKIRWNGHERVGKRSFAACTTLPTVFGLF